MIIIAIIVTKDYAEFVFIVMGTPEDFPVFDSQFSGSGCD